MQYSAEELGQALMDALENTLLKRARSPKVALAVATKGTEIIKRRTAQGLDKQGATFAALSPKYRDWKAKKGRQPIANLAFTGHMLNDIYAKVEGDHAVIAFTSQRVPASSDKADGHIKGSGNLPVRDFFGIDDRPADVSELQRVAEDAIKKVLGGVA